MTRSFAGGRLSPMAHRRSPAPNDLFQSYRDRDLDVEDHAGFVDSDRESPAIKTPSSRGSLASLFGHSPSTLGSMLPQSSLPWSSMLGHKRRNSDEFVGQGLLAEKGSRHRTSGYYYIPKSGRGVRSLLRRGSSVRSFLLFALALAIVIDFVGMMDSAGGYREINRFDDSGKIPKVVFTDRERKAIQLRHGKIFIAAMLWNNGYALGKTWSDNLVDLVYAFGPQNVFISIYESGSWDDTKDQLQALDRRLEHLGVSRRIIMSSETHDDIIKKGPPAQKSTDDLETHWIDIPAGGQGFRRIPYLASLRNRVLEPLQDPTVEINNPHFAMNETRRILWLTDVVFTPTDILALMDTNTGSYAAACALDFSKPPAFYDTFAMRDEGGHALLDSLQFPYFSFSHARRALLSHHQTVRVKSCWNGAIVFNSEPFMGKNGMKFRGLPDSLAQRHVEASESCLVHADNGLSDSLGVWINPAVRVGYSQEAYDAVHAARQWPRRRNLMANYLKDVYYRLKSLISEPLHKRKMHYRLNRWIEEGKALAEKEKKAEKAQGLLTLSGKKKGRVEKGDMCLINEMHVLVYNGWKHV